MSRKPNGASSIYLGKDGDWHGRVTVGVKDDGSPDRRHVRGKTEAIVTKKVRKLERERDTGTVKKAGERWTVAAWLTHWLENISAPNVRENTLSGYRVAVRHHLIPGLGKHRLDKLTPEHLDRFYRKMLSEPMPKTGRKRKPATVHQVHRTARAAFEQAQRRGHISSNPASLAKAPRVAEEEVEPYTVEEIQRLLVATGDRRNSTRWAMALALGFRQGEALGLKWADVDLDKGTVRIRRSRLRPKYKHGCDGECGKKYPGYCPDRKPIRPDTDDTKSRAGRRTVGLPPELVRLLAAHRVEQESERERAGQLWQEGDWVFATPTGAPTNPRTDYDEWKRILAAAKLRDGRLHDARHTAATVLLILRVAMPAAMGIMGWSSADMAKRYQHITDEVRSDIARQVGGLLWAPESDDEGDRKGDGEGPAGAAVPA